MIFEAKSPLDGWQKASAHLMSHEGRANTLVVKFPALSATNETPLIDFCPRRVLGLEFDRARDVANTIFPTKTLSNSKTRPDFYARYLRGHRRRPHHSWGTYFERLICFGDSRVNQLERVISALTTWKNNPRAALVVHISSPELDAIKPLGSPCLQFLQFNCPTRETIELLAVYRSHDFCNKALGNYFGLARLLNFVATESSRTSGVITCLSAHAFYDTSKKNQSRLAGINRRDNAN